MKYRLDERSTKSQITMKPQTIHKGDKVTIKPGWQDAGDDRIDWIALEDEDGGRVRIGATNLGFAFTPNQVVLTSMVCAS